MADIFQWRPELQGKSPCCDVGVTIFFSVFEVNNIFCFFLVFVSSFFWYAFFIFLLLIIYSKKELCPLCLIEAGLEYFGLMIT